MRIPSPVRLRGDEPKARTQRSIKRLASASSLRVGRHLLLNAERVDSQFAFVSFTHSFTSLQTLLLAHGDTTTPVRRGVKLTRRRLPSCTHLCSRFPFRGRS